MVRTGSELTLRLTVRYALDVDLDLTFSLKTYGARCVCVCKQFHIFRNESIHRYLDDDKAYLWFLE